MIRITQTEIHNIEAAIRGMRNPLNSWDKSDSWWKIPTIDERSFVIGPDDLALAMKLSKAGSDHSKFLRQIFVSMDVLAPEYWWKEYETYQVGTTENSTSTMHKLGSRSLTEADFSWEDINLDDGNVQPLNIELLLLINGAIDRWRKDKTEANFRRMIQILPMSYNYLRTCTLNYQVLKNMYHSRKKHKLKEWREFCDWIRSLPYSQLITLEE